MLRSNLVRRAAGARTLGMPGRAPCNSSSLVRAALQLGAQSGESPPSRGIPPGWDEGGGRGGAPADPSRPSARVPLARAALWAGG